MKSAVETLSPTRVKLTVEVPFEELKPSLDAAYKTIAQQINCRASARARSRRGSSTSGSAAARCSSRRSTRPSRSSTSRPSARTTSSRSGQPEIEVTEFEDGETLEFTAEVDVRPEIDAARLLDGLEVEVDDVEVTDERRRRAGRGAARALRHARTPSSAPPPTATSSRSTWRPRRRRGARGRRATGVSYQVGAASMLDGLDEAVDGPDRRRREDLHLPAGGRRRRRRGRRGHGQGHRGQGAGAARARRRVRPAGLRVRHRRRAARPTCRKRLGAASATSRPPQARERVLEKLLDAGRGAAAREAVEDELKTRKHDLEHQQLEPTGLTSRSTSSEGKTEEEFEAETARAGGQGRQGPVRARRDRRARRSWASTRRSSPST